MVETTDCRWKARKSQGRLICWALLSLLMGSFLGCVHHPLPLPGQEKKKDIVDEVMTIGDVTEVANATAIQVTGVGLVTGLNGTGGGNPPGNLRGQLEEDLRKRKFKNPKQALDSKENAMVVVTGLIPPGSRKGDPIDIMLTVPRQSKVTSLQGGTLQPCYLRNFDSTKNLSPEYQGPNRLLPGHVLARAQGPVLVGLDGEADGKPSKKRGRIWQGGVSNLDRPFFLVLKHGKKSSRVAYKVAKRINTMFQDDTRKQMEVMRLKHLMLLDEIKSQINHKFSKAVLGDHTIAKAAGKELIFVNVPWEYRLNQKRYLLLVRLIPLRETSEERVPYRQRLNAMLLDPKTTLRASLRLEALGKESMPALKKGLQSDHPLVRFCSAEALTYLGNTLGVEELSRAARQHPQLRAYCMTALASLNEAVCHMQLRDLLTSSNAEVRYGAFRALQILKDEDPQIVGEELNKSFHLHRVAPTSGPMIHYSLHRKAEIVLFGKETRFVPPFGICAGKEFTITAAPEDQRCTVTRYLMKEGREIHHQCSFQVDDILRTMAYLGAEYPTAVDLLRQANDLKCLNCSVAINAVPQPTPLEELAKAAQDPNFLTTPGMDSSQLVRPETGNREPWTVTSE